MDIFSYVYGHYSQLMHTVAIWALPILVAITFHEAAHGFVAAKYGDPTALSLGRVTLNPLPHISFFGTLLLPLLLVLMGFPAIGYAKPVPVNFRYIKPYKTGVIAVALAGPFMNFILAICSLLIASTFHGASYTLGSFIYEMAWASLIINIILMLFNLIPIPPLDGSRVVSVLLPSKWRLFYGSLERFGILLVIILAMTGLIGDILRPILKYILDNAYALVLMFNI